MKMHDNQRKFFEDPRRRVFSLGRRYGKTQYMQEARQAIEKQVERRGESPIAEQCEPLQIADECKEMTTEDFEKIKDHPLLSKVEGVIQTDKSSDWFMRRFAAGRRPGKTFESMGIPSIWALDACDEEDEESEQSLDKK